MASLVFRASRSALTAAAAAGGKRTAMRAAGASVRLFSAKKNDDAVSNEDITKYFLEMDSKLVKEASTELPIKLSGRTGELVKELWAAGQKAKNFDKLVKELEGVVAAAEGAGLVVDRFFQSSNYSDEECKKVVDLLLSSKESLASFKDIKDADVREVLVDNEGNLDAWRGARKAVAAVGLSDATKALLEAMAADGNLARVKRVASKAAELRAVTSKTVDVTVASAVPLSKAQQEAVSKALPAYAGAGASVAVQFTVDPAVLGGLLVTLKNQTIDLSSTSRLVEVVAAQ